MDRASRSSLRLRSLWTTYLLAMLFHVDLGLMPLFHGLSPEIESKVPTTSLGMVFWGMLIYFLIPLISILLIAYAESSQGGSNDVNWARWRRIHLVISWFYTITNIPHLLADILVPDSRGDQVFLMVVLLVIGLMINREAWIWFRSCRD